jgi:hypothetical protein
MAMRAGREDGSGQVYDPDANLLMYQDEYVVSTDSCFITSNCPEAPFPIIEATVYLTNWRLVALGPLVSHVDVQTVSAGTHSHLSVVPGGVKSVAPYLEIFLDEVREFKKTLLGEIKLRMQVGTIEISSVSKPFRVELSKALEWYLTPKR